MKYFIDYLHDRIICRTDDKLPTHSRDLSTTNLIRHAGWWHRTRQNQPISIAYFSGFVEISKEEANRICKENYNRELKYAKDNNQ